WLPIGAASVFLGVHRNTLYTWRRNGCPLLGGRKLKTRWRVTRPPVGVGHVRILEFSRVDLEAIRDAQAEGGHRQDDHERWLSAAEARSQFGYYPELLKTWSSKEGCPFLGGERLRTRTRIVVTGNRKACYARVYQLSQLEQISARRCDLAQGSE